MEMNKLHSVVSCSDAEEAKQLVAERELMIEVKKEIMQVLKMHNLTVNQAVSALVDCRSEISARLDCLLINEHF